MMEKRVKKKTPSLFFRLCVASPQRVVVGSGRHFFHEHRTRHCNVVFIPRHSSWSSPGVAQSEMMTH